MILRSVAAGVLALSLSASSAFAAEEPAQPTPQAQAAPPAPQAAPPAPQAAPAATPLAPRKPLTLAPAQEPHTPVGYKLLAALGVAAAGFLWWKKKKQGAPESAAKKKSSIDVLGRTSVGMRSDLLVVDVEGTRLLVGLTPGSMQTLAVLEQPVAEVVTEEEPEEPKAEVAPASKPTLRDELERDEEAEELHDRVKLLLARKAAEAKLPRNVKPPPRKPRSTRVAGQAKGLLLALEASNDDPKPAFSGNPTDRA